MVDSPLRDQPLLVFSKNGPARVGQVDSSYEISFDDATRNVVVLGGTGRGKTESIMLPAAGRMIGNGCTGLILDAKGDFTILAEQYSDAVGVVGPGTGTRINLLAGIELGTFRALMEDMQGRYHQSEKYWGSLGVEDAVLVFLYVRETGRDPSLRDIHDGLSKPQEFCLNLERSLRTRETVSKALIEQIRSRLQDEFGLLRLGGFQGEESESSRAKEQYSWQTNAIVKAIGVIVSNPDLERAFCAASSDSIEQLVFSDRKTLVLDVNADQYPDAAFTIGRMLRLQFMKAVTTTYRKRRSEGLGKDTFTFMLLDEYQQFVNAAVQRQTDTLRDDNTWFDRSRGYGHINIVATQSISSLYAQVDRSAADTIIQNCQNTIILPTTDGPTLDRAALLCESGSHGASVRESLLNPSTQGEGFVHVANSSARRGGSAAGLMKAGVVTAQESAFMNAYIGTSQPVSRHSRSPNQQELARNPYSREQPSRFNGRLHVVLNRQYPRASEWLTELTDNPAISFVGIIDFVAHRNLPWDRRGEGYDDYVEEVEPDDLVLIPNFRDARQVGVLRSNQLLELIDGVREAGAGVLLGPPSEKTLDLERKTDGVFYSAGELLGFVHGLIDDGEDMAT